MANTIDILGDAVVLRSLLEGTITEFEDEFILEVESNRFHACSNLQRVSLSRATRIGGSAFSNCSNLISVYLPSAELLESGVFTGCSLLESISLPSANEFRYQYMFQNCSALRSAWLPRLTSIHYGTFWGCTNLTDVHAPLAESVENTAFRNCETLREISLPKLNHLFSRSSMDWPNLETIYVGTETDSVCAMDYSDCLPASIQNIYVPDDLVDEYKAATNWSNFASAIKGVSEAT